MKKDKALRISLISILLFNVFFIIMLIGYNDIIIIPNSFFKSITKEYYFWYMDRPLVYNESIIMGITGILKPMFSLILSLEFFYIIFNNKYINVIEKKNLVISLIIGCTIYCLSFLFIKYGTEHYRLFMTLISTEILSIILLNLVLKVRKEITLI
ncbi:hypothetical protein CLLI_06440 [Clostridium liquoris]|uniref:Uncharacterized protein n=1 Tax=Clostridium liquoris TaxID=1289519 RepID=A0A2T0B7P4_9CLOT|nr:hypothetical protein [Clostridium liquoris]PRR79911.1 hypothetical protein CLLI_06440 [Clostridium liquoris]